MLRRGSKESTTASSTQQQHGSQSQQTSPALLPSTDASTNLSASLNSSQADKERDHAVLSGDESETVNSGERESRWDYHSHSSKLEAPGVSSAGGNGSEKSSRKGSWFSKLRSRSGSKSHHA
ncbi:unnamed protein product [Ambrosiozyma monospora]|uniref:Unnamed protein product n=1 Tax=Ambrosiozyma monospora TaxID=43982 RepID=A0ACB5TU39_AMBMO|nr:unnamed protein product [Ambrosiozyma monospora]